MQKYKQHNKINHGLAERTSIVPSRQQLPLFLNKSADRRDGQFPEVMTPSDPISAGHPRSVPYMSTHHGCQDVKWSS